MSSSTTKGGAFEKNVEQLLRLKGYTVSRNELINGTQIDLVARKDDLLSNLCFVVECTDRDNAVGVDLVKQKASILLSLSDPRYLFRLLYVARFGFTAEAKAFASSQPNVLLLTSTDLENQLIDFHPYINWYTYSYENSTGFFREGRLFKNYVELIARDEKDKPIASLTTEVRHWLSEDENNLLFLLGEYGSGKTSFCRHLIYQLLIEKYQTRTGQDFIPLLINLREHRSGSPNLQQVITDTLINQYGVQLPSFLAFEHVCSSGRVLLVMDGFDEMAEKSDKQTLIDSFNQVYLLASLDAKVILTCRSNFFHSHNDVIDLLKHFSINIPSSDTASPNVVQIDFDRHGRLLFVEKLNSDQIREFIAKRFGEQAEDIYAQINSIHDLSDLSSRPVLLDMILTTLPELSKSEKKINSAALYQHYTDKWTGRDNWRVKLPLAVRQHFTEILAWVMQNMRLQEIDYSVLEQVMARSVEPLAETVDQLETFKNDIQTCSFLVRIGRKDQFRFAHKSFQEFFVARKIITDLLQGLSVTKAKDNLGLLDATDYEQRLGLIWPMHGSFSSSIGVPSSFTYFYDVIDSRLKNTRAYLTLHDVSLSRHWPDFRSENAVKHHLQEQIREVLAQRGISDKSGAFGLSAEISTFATEYLENTEVPLSEFIGKLVDSESLTVFCDILRLTQSVGLVERNFDFAKQYVMTGKEELLKISTCAALAKTSSLIDFDFVRDARGAMSPEGWSYFLLELANQQNLHKGILKQCYALEDLRTLDKLICVHGLRGQLPDVESNLVTEDLVMSLLQSSNDQEKLLGITLCYSINISRRTLAGIMSQVLEGNASNPVRVEAVAVLGSLTGKEIWQLLRVLWAKEKDESIKKLLKEAEQRVRTATSQEGSRVAWNQAKSNSAVREQLWRSLRR